MIALIFNARPLQVDMSKIKLDVIKPWIQDKITEILKIDDDVVVDFVYNQLDEKVLNLVLVVFIIEFKLSILEIYMTDI